MSRVFFTAGGVCRSLSIASVVPRVGRCAAHCDRACYVPHPSRRRLRGRASLNERTEFMKAYHEYLELYLYFARSGEQRLSADDFAILDEEFKRLAAKHPTLDEEERRRLAALKAVLFRDKP